MKLGLLITFISLFLYVMPPIIAILLLLGVLCGRIIEEEMQ